MNKKKLVRVVKNLLITGLVALCIFQTSVLWFGEADFGLGFPRFLSGLTAGGTAETSDSDALYILTSPYRIISGRAGRYSVTYHVSSAPEKPAADRAIEAALKYGGLNTDYIDLSPAIIIYEYAVSIPSHVFAARFNAGFLSGNINAIDAIYFLADNSVIHICFADKTAALTVIYTLHDPVLADALHDTAVSAARAFYYERRGGVFIPRWDGSWHTFNIASADLNFPSPPSALPSSALIERQVSSFFDRPSVVVSRMVDMFSQHYHMFSSDSSESVVVRYHSTGVLEYSNFSFISNQTLQCFVSSFALALEVIARDETLSNTVYLSGYTQNTLGYTFYFDAIVNNFPVSISRDISNTLGMSSFMEITVANNYINYKRYAVSYNQQPETENATICFDRFTQILLSMIGQTINTNNERNLRFGYMAAGEGEMLLHWSIGWFVGENWRTFDSGAVE
jgi:hypothetical protein